MTESNPNDPSLERRLGRLEEILTAIEADELDLSDALRLFEEGVGHVRAAEALLSEARLKVDEILGPDRVAPLDGEEADG